MAQLVYATTPSAGCPGQRAIAIALVEPLDATQVARIEQAPACAKIMRMSETYHRNDQPDRVRAASGRRAPIVAAELASGEVVVLLEPDELDRCGGSPDRLLSAVEHALADAGLSWASP